MESLLQQLENNEAVLLMYMADELPADDRMEVEQMLASDSALRNELAELQGATSHASDMLRRADAAAPSFASEAATARQFSRTMAQWQIDRLSRQPAVLLKHRRHIPWWIYPIATAASVVIVFLIYWGNRAELPGVELADVTTQPDDQNSSPDKPRDGDGPVVAENDSTPVPVVVSRSFGDAEESVSTLHNAEREMLTLFNRTDEASAIFLDAEQ